jgi:hypothetical protein
MPSNAWAMAKARDADRGSLARRAHIRNEAGVRSRLIAKAMPFASAPFKDGQQITPSPRRGTAKRESRVRLGGIIEKGSAA